MTFGPYTRFHCMSGNVNYKMQKHQRLGNMNIHILNSKI